MLYLFYNNNNYNIKAYFQQITPKVLKAVIDSLSRGNPTWIKN